MDLYSLQKSVLKKEETNKILLGPEFENTLGKLNQLDLGKWNRFY